MLGKLIKYELKSEIFSYAVLYIILGVLSVSFLIIDKVISRFMQNEMADNLRGLVMTLFVIVCVIALAMVFFLAGKRMYTNLYKDEGYLMHTLPVHECELFAAKAICCYIWLLATAVVIAACVTVISGIDWIGKIPDAINAMRLSINKDFPSADFWNLYFYFIIFKIVLTPISFMIYIYFCISIGGLFSKNKGLMAIITFIAVNFLSQIISVVFVSGLGFNYVNGMDELAPQVMENVFRSIIIFSVCFTVVVFTAMYIGANYIMRKKLNLE